MRASICPLPSAWPQGGHSGDRPTAAVAPAPPDCAFSMVGPVSLGCYAIWDDESADADNLAWLRATSRALGDAALGYYVGETDFDAVASRGRRPFSPASWQRLAELRRKYDPTSVFHDPPEARAPDRHLDDGCASIGSWQPRAGRSPT